MKISRIITVAALSLGTLGGIADTAGVASASTAASSSGHGTTAFQQSRVNKVLETYARKWVAFGAHPTSNQEAYWFDGFGTAISNTVNYCYVINQESEPSCIARYEPIGSPAAAYAFTSLGDESTLIYDSWWASQVVDINYLIRVYDHWLYKTAYYYDTPAWAVNDLR